VLRKRGSISYQYLDQWRTQLAVPVVSVLDRIFGRHQLWLVRLYIINRFNRRTDGIPLDYQYAHGLDMF
jgi:hypothetical protein